MLPSVRGTTWRAPALPIFFADGAAAAAVSSKWTRRWRGGRSRMVIPRPTSLRQRCPTLANRLRIRPPRSCTRFFLLSFGLSQRVGNGSLPHGYHLHLIEIEIDLRAFRSRIIKLSINDARGSMFYFIAISWIAYGERMKKCTGVNAASINPPRLKLLLYLAFTPSLSHPLQPCFF